MVIPIEMSPASTTIHKTPTKHKISDDALIHIQRLIDKIKRRNYQQFIIQIKMERSNGNLQNQ